MSKKQSVVSTLFASLLLILIIIPTAHQQGGGTYDPWLDSNEDGQLDINELGKVGQAYGSSGNPTRNVNVTNFPLDEQGNLKMRFAPVASTSVNLGEVFSWKMAQVIDVQGNLYAYLGVEWGCESYRLMRLAKWQNGWMELSYSFNPYSFREYVTLSPYRLNILEFKDDYLTVQFLEN